MITSTKPEAKPAPKPVTKYEEASWTKPSTSKPAKIVEEPDLPRARKSTGRDPLTSPEALAPFAPDLPVTDLRAA